MPTDWIRQTESVALGGVNGGRVLMEGRVMPWRAGRLWWSTARGHVRILFPFAVDFFLSLKLEGGNKCIVQLLFHVVVAHASMRQYHASISKTPYMDAHHLSSAFHSGEVR